MESDLKFNLLSTTLCKTLFTLSLIDDTFILLMLCGCIHLTIAQWLLKLNQEF